MGLRFPWLVLPIVFAATTANSAPTPSVPADVQAVIQKQCAECHNAKKRKGGLDLTSTTGIAHGGRNGPVVTPKTPQTSRLWLMIDKEKMPPENPLSEPDRRILRQWIEGGAQGLT